MAFGQKSIGKDADESESLIFPVGKGFGVSSSMWWSIWRKLKKEKSEIFRPRLRSARVSYDPETYAMNFDNGVASFEPDNLSRSFSARFADPSWISRGVGW
ncbi:hypothetical protein AMTR_s00078p00182690 [Amborella trichopoda]|uniref:Uncharacterized protein n=1 Tax=Amborella trichopoda TaxID=13333 RepID=W1P892_AMBTC|nr:hypothetical protein AMTR_s00078p00182690 [Amborella trichopoda]